MSSNLVGGLRYKVCQSCGDMHDVHDWPANHAKPGELLAAPQVIRDEMPMIQGQHDGKMYDSKRAIRASYQPSGNAEGKYFTEIGNEVQKRVVPKPDKKAIRQSIEKATAQVRNGQTTERTTKKLLSRPGPVLSRKGLA